MCARCVLYHRVAMATEKRIHVKIGPIHREELKWLMDLWGFNLSNTIRTIISRVVREEKERLKHDRM